MTTEMLDIVLTVDYAACQRARRLQFAIGQLNAGTTEAECRRLILERFKCSRMTAWRIVDMAVDMAGEVKK